MKPYSAMLGHTEDLVRIEGVRGSNPLSSTEFFHAGEHDLVRRNVSALVDTPRGLEERPSPR
jgi:hypothetical protein